MRVVFLGPPGAGKSTHAREVAREWSVPHIATGDMLREVAAAKTPLGREVKGYMESGELVSDEAIIGLVAERLGRADTAHGWFWRAFRARRSGARAAAAAHGSDDAGTHRRRFKPTRAPIFPRTTRALQGPPLHRRRPD
jgi:adenylate kinase